MCTVVDIISKPWMSSWSLSFAVTIAHVSSADLGSRMKSCINGLATLDVLLQWLRLHTHMEWSSDLTKCLTSLISCGQANGASAWLKALISCGQADGASAALFMIKVWVWWIWYNPGLLSQLHLTFYLSGWCSTATWNGPHIFVEHIQSGWHHS